MPRRAPQHIIADQAIAAVKSICASCGWACDEVQSDYGEDLLVQTHLDGTIDAFKIWIQVKGTTKPPKINSEGHIHYKISIEHASKWIDSPDIVIFILWDISNSVGYYVSPMGAIDKWELYKSNQSDVRLLIDKESLFTVQSMQDLAWNARIHHYYVLLLKAQARDAAASEEKNSHVLLIACELLALFKIVEGNGFSKTFLERFERGKKKIASEDSSLTPRKVELCTLILCILNATHDVHPKLGLPKNLLHLLANWTGVLLEKGFPQNTKA